MAELPPPQPTAPAPPMRPRSDSPRETMRGVLQAAVLLLTVFLVIRIVMLEPYGVPTGSMAPALIGNHREALCPRCNHTMVVGDPGGAERFIEYPDGTCPNCGKQGLNFQTGWEVPGDRLLVDKNVFNLRSPRRFEVAVFRTPVDTTKPYVKRILGLPGEAIQLIGGEVYASGELVRKSIVEVRETRIPVFMMEHYPVTGWGKRWLVEPLADAARANPPAPNVFADTKIALGGELHLNATTPDTLSLGLTYTHTNLDTHRESALTDALAYNAYPRRGSANPVHDFSLVCEVEVLAGDGQFACRLSDGLGTAEAVFPIGKPGNGIALQADGNETPHRAAGQMLEVGQTYRIEFAFVDRRASLTIDGREVVKPIDRPGDADTLARRGQVSRPLQFGIKGASVVVRKLVLYRDVYYRPEGTNGISAPHQLAADEYYVLGDNSGNSHDSREWALPGVPERDFLGKPFLIHQPLKVGRVGVNGAERLYQTVDWARLRWVR